MFGSTILDVVIGLVFVFFVFSLLASGINELVRKVFNTRAKALWKSIGQILDEGPEAFRSTVPSVTIGVAPERLAVAPTAVAGEVPLSSQRLMEHPLVRSLDPARPGNQTRIHHIPNREFARAAVDLLTPRADDDVGTPLWDAIGTKIEELPEGLRDQFRLLYEEASGDIVEFRNAIEDWFDTRMQQVSDWYQKRTRWALAAYGILIAGVFNVSAIGVTTELYENDLVRDSLVALSETSTKTVAAIDECLDRECVEDKVTKLIDTGLPLWWRQCPVLNEDGNSTGTTELCGFEDFGRAAISVAGWAVTAAALAMGASFWFAMLKRALGLKKREAT